MAPQSYELLCKANQVIAPRLKDEIESYRESQKDRMVIIFRKALKSVKEYGSFPPVT